MGLRNWFLNPIIGLLHSINTRIFNMSEALDRLTREVAESKTAVSSLTTLVAGLAAQIRDNVDDEDALNALADDLDAQQAEIAAAVTANTPGDGEGTTASD